MTDATTASFEAEPLPARPRRKLMTPVGGVAGAVLIAACGFIGGVQVEKKRSTNASGTGANAFARFGGGTGAAGGTGRTGTGTGAGGGTGQTVAAGRTGAGGGFGAGGTGSDATVGSVSSVDGKTFYVALSSGDKVRVKTNQQSKVTRTAVAGATEIHPGDTVIVQGTAASTARSPRPRWSRRRAMRRAAWAPSSAVAEGRAAAVADSAAARLRARPTAANERTRDMSVEEYEDDYEGGGNARLVIAAVVAVVLIAGAFFAGKAMAGSGPKTLADAVKQAQAGDLPCGDTGAAPTPAANGAPPAGGFGANGAQFMVRAICDRTRAPAVRGRVGRVAPVPARAASAAARAAASGRPHRPGHRGHQHLADDPVPARQSDGQARPEHQGVQVLKRRGVGHQEGRHGGRRRRRRRLPPAAEPEPEHDGDIGADRPLVFRQLRAR